MWITQLTSDLKGLTEERHISNVPDVETFSQIYKATASTNLANGTVHKVTTFNNAPEFMGAEGKPLEFAIHLSTKGDVYWERIEECFHRRHLFKKYEVVSYKFGYVAGTHSPFAGARGMTSAGLLPGYQMWEDLSVKDLN